MASRPIAPLRWIPALPRAPARFVGRPLSRRPIAEIEATIARLSRGVGRPFPCPTR